MPQILLSGHMTVAWFVASIPPLAPPHPFSGCTQTWALTAPRGTQSWVCRGLCLWGDHQILHSTAMWKVGQTLGKCVAAIAGGEAARPRGSLGREEARQGLKTSLHPQML